MLTGGLRLALRRAPALAAAALLTACAGPGHPHVCDADAGDCGSANPDGGRPDLPPFLGQPVLVAHDGLHDGFPDVARFAGQAVAAFRRASGRGFDGTAHIQTLRSADKGKTWVQGQALSLPGFDLRDPKLTEYAGRLLLTFTAWDVTDPTQNRTYVRAAVSDDGATFTLLDAPTLPQPFGLAAWRPRATSDALLLPVWTSDELLTHPELNHVSLLRSTDAVGFSLASTLPVGGGGTQPELLVQSGGRLLVTAPEQQTGADPQRQDFCRATLSGATTSAWDCWSASGPRIETPALYEWSGIVLLAGRHDLGDGRKRTALWQVLEDDRALSLLLDFDTMGDTGAPSFLALDANTVLVVFYSTSQVDPQVTSLGHEPTEVESIRMNLAADVIAVPLSLDAAPIGK